MDQALTEMRTLGLPIHVTELDVNSTLSGQRNTGADVAANAAAAQGGLVADADAKLAGHICRLVPSFREASRGN